MEKHARYVQQFEAALEAGLPGREEAETARNYFDDKQWTDEEKAALQKRKQPIVWENLIKPKVESLCGMERQGRVDPIAYPRVPSKEQDANAATDALRYVEQDQDLDIKKSKVFENMLIEGEGGVEVAVRRQRNGVIDPYVVRISYDRLYGDPHSSEADRSDASYVGYITWMDVERAKKKWPEKVDVIEATQSRGVSSTFDSYDDKPKWAAWYDEKRKRIRINTHYHLEGGVWHKCVFTLSGELEESAPSVFLDDEGNPECPLIMQAAYVDQDNDRYGIVRSMIPLQDEVNKRRSKFLHMVNSNRWRVGQAQQQDKEMLRKELARPDAIVIGDSGEVESLDMASKDAAQFTLYQSTVASLKGNVGPNAYLQGKQGENQSGRAVLAQQQAGMTEMAPLLDNLRHFTIRVYRQIWNRIRQYWTEERWIRVTDDERNVRFVGLNTRPEMTPEQAILAAQMVQMTLANGEIDQATAQQYLQEIQKKAQPGNAIGELDVDIEIEEVNETPTLQIEQFEQLATLIGQSQILAGNPKALELLIQASNLRDKQKLIDIIQEMQQPNPEAQAMQQQAMQVQMAGAQAEVEETKSKTMLNVAKAQSEQARPLVESFKAGQQSGAAM